MSDLLEALQDGLRRLGPDSALDILLIAAIIFGLLLMVRGTAAVAILRGVAILAVAVLVLSRFLELTLLKWLLDRGFTALLLAIPIIFQPEIRRALERVGRAGGRGWLGRVAYDETIQAVVAACLRLSFNRHGALLVLERETGLEEYCETGVRVDAAPSPELLEGLFYPNSPLHDGAVVFKENRVTAAACTLPLSEKISLGSLGTRHRAALGISERTDAVAVVVSEQTGAISLAADGRLVSSLDGTRLQALLSTLLHSNHVPKHPQR